MLDLVGIVFSGVMMMFIVYRALLMDSLRPWFEKEPQAQDVATASNPGGGNVGARVRPPRWPPR